MNHIIRKATKEENIYSGCDFCAIRNNNNTYFILTNEHGSSNITVGLRIFTQMISLAKQPVVLPVGKIIKNKYNSQ